MKLYQFTQLKTAKVTGTSKIRRFKYKANHTNVSNSKCLYAFQHRYAQFKGDKRALEPSFIDLIRLRVVQFPTNEQMIYDSGQDLKQKLKSIITRNKFRN